MSYTVVYKMTKVRLLQPILFPWKDIAFFLLLFLADKKFRSSSVTAFLLSYLQKNLESNVYQRCKKSGESHIVEKRGLTHGVKKCRI